MNVDKIMNGLEQKHPGEAEYLQAVREVLESIKDIYSENAHLENSGIIERLIEPDRIYTYKIAWLDDQGKVNLNLAYRIQFNNALGPYKGGLRFHPSVNLSILKFLGFEQIFKNSLTTLPMGGAEGGSDFDARGKSDAEIMRFTQSFMIELWRHVGPQKDVPAGDIGVGGREIGYLYGMYKKLARENTGVITGKGVDWGGCKIRPEAPGYGNVYFTMKMLETINELFKGKTVAVSGFGNVAWGVIKKVTELGAKVVTISGPDGYIFDPDGITDEKIDYLLELRACNEDIVKPYSYRFQSGQFYERKKPWEQKVDIAIPCATQNELDKEDAQLLIKNGCICVSEGANMPCTPEAINVFYKNKILFAPAKAASAGGVAMSGLEMSQNSIKLNWTREEEDEQLHNIMIKIHDECLKYGTTDNGYVNYVKGANIAGFLKVANSMIDQGIM
ncbi:MAG: NADP-specific glutamate dehydrogenase [Bacteroidota bacterium]|nr:NADP-specific glutamate dehydrogenase [Bacteroidota bacterium]